MMELPNAMINMDVWTMKRERTLEFIFANGELPTVCRKFARYIRQVRNRARLRVTRQRMSKRGTEF